MLDVELAKALSRASDIAKRRVARRKIEAKRAKLENLRAQTDPFIAKLSTKLSKGESARFGLDRNQCFYNQAESRWEPLGVAAFLAKRCQRLGLKTTVEVHVEVVGYSERWSGTLVVSK